MRQKGIGEAKAIELKAALELGRRLLITEQVDHPVVRSPADAAALGKGEACNQTREVKPLWAVPTARRGSLIGSGP